MEDPQITVVSGRRSNGNLLFMFGEGGLAKGDHQNLKEILPLQEKEDIKPQKMGGEADVNRKMKTKYIKSRENDKGGRRKTLRRKAKRPKKQEPP